MLQFDQITFDVHAASEGMMDIFRVGSPQVLHADQDMETRLLRAVVHYVGQRSLSSKVLIDEGIRSLAEHYCSGHRWISLQSTLRMSLEEIPALGVSPNPRVDNSLAIDLPWRSSFYYPRIRGSDLVFAYEGEVREDSLVLTPRDPDDFIVSLFNAAYSIVGIRATVETLAKALDLEYLRIKK